MMSEKEFESKEYQRVYKLYMWSDKPHGFSVAEAHNNTLDKVFEEGIALGRWEVLKAFDSKLTSLEVSGGIHMELKDDELGQGMGMTEKEYYALRKKYKQKD